MSMRSVMVRGAWTSACAALCLGCTSAQDGWSSAATEFPFAYVHDDCAPWDGAALSIGLTHEELSGPSEVSFPSVWITSWRPPAELAGGSFEWSDDAGDLGYASWCATADSCVRAATVRVRFDRDQPSPDDLAGQVHLEFEDGRVVSGAFKARWLQRAVLCG